MYISRRLLSFSQWNSSSTAWLFSKWGRRARIGLLCGTIVSYPVGALLINGPLVNVSFPKRFAIQEIPEYLTSVVKQEYERFLDKEVRLADDAVCKFDMLSEPVEQDSVAAGSLGVRTGLRVALPFYARFRTVEEALDYLRKHYPNGIPQLGEMVSVQWDTSSGRELAETFVLSEQAWRFAVLRDLFAHDGYAALGQRSISWATWTSFTGIFTYWLHRQSKLLGGTALSFIGLYAVFTSAAYYANKHWHYLYRFMTDVYSDSTSAHTSFDHSTGGKEFYYKQLKRNRILRDLHPTMYTKITPSGDVRGIPTSIIVRFDHLKDLEQEDDELKEVVSGDF